MKNLVFLWTCMTLWCHVDSALDTSVCTPPPRPTSGPPRPQLPPLFTVNTECNMKDKSYGVNIMEWYDGPGNRAVVKHRVNGQITLDYFYYNTNEILVVNTTSGLRLPSCAVQALNTSNNQFLFGLHRFRNGSEHIDPHSGVFQFGDDIHEQYLGRREVRGIQTDAWYSCVYWAALNSTMNVTWYFTANNAWKSASAVSQAPVRCHVTGRRYTSATMAHNFDHIYEFAYFSPKVNSEEQNFEVPPRTMCRNRKSHKKIPDQGSYFRVRTEMVMSQSSFVSFIWEWYDFTTKVSRFQYRTLQSAGSPYGTNLMTEIQDFNTGLTFLIDTVRGNCTVKQIAPGKGAINVDAHHVRMESLKYYYDNHDANTMSYEGVKTVRNIDCDVWVMLRNDWPVPGSNVTSTWEWYFASQKWLRAHGFRNNYALPVMTTLAAPSMNYYATFNAYDYDEDEPSLLNFDTTTCFGPSEKKDIKFVLPAEYKDYVSDEKFMFRYFVLISVSSYTSVSPTRINNIKIDYLDSDDVLVKLRMLDIPPIKGDSASQVYQLPLSEAVSILTYGINNSNFTITINGVAMKARPYSVTSSDTIVEEHPWKNVKLEYTGVSVVGLAVGMLLVSYVFGFIIYIVVKKKRQSALK